MNILLFDIDTLRADHLGCYGYCRNTSENIDHIAHDGICFDNYYCCDAPCLPSRAAMYTGKYGIHNGIIGHDGTAAELRVDPKERDFRNQAGLYNLPAVMRTMGFRTASVSTFAERHSAWWFNAGFNEVINIGKSGDEIAQDVTPEAIKWIERNKNKDSWFLHVHYWDPHTLYRTPAEYGNPFEGEESDAIDWITQDVFNEHKQATGFHSANELSGLNDRVPSEFALRQLGKLDSLEDVRKNVDGYDCGIWNADQGIGEIVIKLKEYGLYEDTAIIVTSDHGEDLGELGRYSEHGCADYPVNRIPMIVKWPGGEKGGIHLDGFHYNIDLLPTLIDLMKDECGYHSPYEQVIRQMFGEDYANILWAKTKEAYDGKSFAEAILKGIDSGHEYLVLGCATHSVQRSVRFDDYIYIRTYHDGYCRFPRHMLFDLKNDPHEQHNLADSNPELLYKASYLLSEWVDEQMKENVKHGYNDPIWTVLNEGGPYHVKGQLDNYLKRLDETGRSKQAEELKQIYKV